MKHSLNNTKPKGFMMKNQSKDYPELKRTLALKRNLHRKAYNEHTAIAARHKSREAYYDSQILILDEEEKAFMVTKIQNKPKKSRRKHNSNEAILRALSKLPKTQLNALINKLTNQGE